MSKTIMEKIDTWDASVMNQVVEDKPQTDAEKHLSARV